MYIVWLGGISVVSIFAAQFNVTAAVFATETEEKTLWRDFGGVNEYYHLVGRKNNGLFNWYSG